MLGVEPGTDKLEGNQCGLGSERPSQFISVNECEKPPAQLSNWVDLCSLGLRDTGVTCLMKCLHKHPPEKKGRVDLTEAKGAAKT